MGWAMTDEKPADWLMRERARFVAETARELYRDILNGQPRYRGEQRAALAAVAEAKVLWAALYEEFADEQ